MHLAFEGTYLDVIRTTNMPRTARLDIESGFYHVYNRGNNRKALFLTNEDYLDFLKILCKTKEIFEFKLHAYCLMPNHFHFLMERREVPLSFILKRVEQIYAQRFNKRYESTGHLFEGRFKSKICKDDTHFKTVSRYVHRNPVRASLVNSPEEWRWSGVHAFGGGLIPADSLVDTEFTLSVFGDDQRSISGNYLRFLAAPLSDSELVQIRSELLEEKSKVGDVDSVSNSIECASNLLSEICSEVCLDDPLLIAAVIGRSKNRELSKLRRTIAIEARKNGHTLVAVADFLSRSTATVSKLISRIHARGNQ